MNLLNISSGINRLEFPGTQPVSITPYNQYISRISQKSDFNTWLSYVPELEIFPYNVFTPGKQYVIEAKAAFTIEYN